MLMCLRPDGHAASEADIGHEKSPRDRPHASSPSRSPRNSQQTPRFCRVSISPTRLSKPAAELVGLLLEALLAPIPEFDTASGVRLNFYRLLELLWLNLKCPVKSGILTHELLKCGE